MHSSKPSSYVEAVQSKVASPKITIAIPYYKNLKQLKSALESLINQTCTDWIAVVLDDLGGEDAEVLVRSFADARIHYHRNETNLGLAENWNKGISLAETELVTLFHADDQLMPNYIEVMLQLMERYPEAAAGHCRAKVISESGEKYWSFQDEIKKLIRPWNRGDIVTAGESGLNSIFCGSWIFFPTLCYRKTKLSGYKFQRNWKFIVDIDFMSQILLDGGSFVGSSITAYEYRRHKNNQTAILTKSLLRFQEEFRFLDQLKPRLMSLNWKRSVRKSKIRMIPRLHLMYEATKYLLQKDFSMVRETSLMALRGR